MITRRGFGGAIGASALLGSLAPASAAKPKTSFPRGFRWGCATAAYQIEGAANEDGRGASIWDTFSHTPGKVVNGDTGDVACDSYHRYPEDTQLLKGLGANAYRLSIAWPRIFPEGRGKPNQKGIDHYNRLIDNLLENGIEPHVTLFHWDLPVALPGGWQSRDTAYAFGDYVSLMAEQLVDRVGHFITINEPRSFIDAGYGFGVHAPGLRLKMAEVRQAGHHALLAHGLAVQAIRAKAKRKVQIGVAENPFCPVPVIDTPENVAAARAAMRRLNGPYLTTILEGAYPDFQLAAEAHPPKIEQGDMKIIASPIDFIALNVYAPVFVKADANAQGYTIVPMPKSYPTMALPWIYVGPEAGYWAVRLFSEIWKVPSIYISENGCAADDAVVNGQVADTDRVMYLRNYIGALQRATAEGYPLHGYFVWSLLDNFEWSEGYSKRFGIHYVDFKTQQRIPKLSAAWYRELIRRNGMV